MNSQLLAAARIGVGAMIFAVLALAGCGTSASEKKSEATVARLQRTLNRDDLCAPAWSPDGKRIVYLTRAKPEDVSNGIKVGNPLLAMIDADGTRGTLIADGIPGKDPQWSPDGSRLAFAQKRAGLRVINVDGTGLRKLTDEDASQPAWSPDGTKIVYGTGDTFGEGRQPIEVVNVNGSARTQVVRSVGYGNAAPSWSPDGTAIAFEKFTPPPAEGEFPPSSIAVMKADGSGLRVVGPGGVDEPRWSPDGDRIAFGGFGGLSIVKADGTGLKSVTEPNGFAIASPSWSPDGERVAYSGVRGFHRADIYVIDASGGEALRLTTISEGGGLDKCPAWSPDGTKIAFLRTVPREKGDDRDWGAIFVVHSDGSGEGQLTQTKP
jgi:Tol biopolymer transport system component